MTENEDLISRSTLLESFRKCYSGHMGMENSDNMMTFKSIYRIINEQESIGTIEEFKALKEADMRGANRAVDEFANYLHKIAKENNGLRLSSETKSWTHPCIFDYLEEFKDEQICKEET